MKSFWQIWLVVCLAAGLTCSASENISVMQSELAQKAERELRGNILPFWLKYAPDRERGGFHGLLKADLTPLNSAPRGSLLTCRILWTFSAAYRRYHEPAALEMARWAYEELMTHFWDKQNGGIYWTITAEGELRDTSKQIYGQVFGIFALSEYHRATSDPQALEQAVALYRAVEKYGRDPVHGGYFEVFTRDWRKERASKSPVNAVAAKSQNTHLHVMEAYTNLLRVWPDEELRVTLKTLLGLMLTRIYDPERHHLRLFLTEDWKPKSDHCSYGHDIEAAWLMTEAARVLGDDELIQQTRRVAVEIAETTLKESVDRDGGIFNEGGPGGVIDSQKDWWPQAEAVVGFLNAYQISGDKRFMKAAGTTWAFIEKHVVDREQGEWFQSIGSDGAARELPKISLWKCPYHNSRACLEVIERLSSSDAKPVEIFR